MNIILIDPNGDQLWQAFLQVAGYPFHDEICFVTKRSMNLWPKGNFSTCPGNDGKYVSVDWEWISGSVKVTITKK